MALQLFRRVALINLPSRPDRLRRVCAELNKSGWPFQEPHFVEAVDGALTPAPSAWKSGGGAWGCMLSHRAVFEQAIADGVESLLVLEDNVCFVDEFAEKMHEFLGNVPDDWDMLMLGGQHVNVLGRPTLVKPGVYRCTDCERTHCYAIRGPFMQTLLDRWRGGGTFNGEVHCDWIMGRDPEMQNAHKVYAPERFLAGQERGRSDINGAVQPRKFWNPPAPEAPVVVLRAPAEILPELRTHGLHTGFSRDHDSDTGRVWVLADASEYAIACGQQLLPRIARPRLSRSIQVLKGEDIEAEHPLLAALPS